jgi:hypothetical protein
MVAMAGEWYATPVFSWWAKICSSSRCAFKMLRACDEPDRVTFVGLLTQATCTVFGSSGKEPAIVLSNT